MVVMDLRPWTEWKVSERDEPQVITRVTIHRLSYPNTNPQPYGVDVTTEEEWTSKEWYTCCHKVLYWMSVLKGKCYRLVVLMVHLVNVFVHEWSVKESVYPVEQGIFNNNEYWNVDEHLRPVEEESVIT